MTPAVHSVPARHQAAALYRALTLDERAAACGQAGRTAEAGERGARRLRTWKQQYPFESGALFARRLAAAGLDESQLQALLTDTDTDLQQRHAAPPDWLSQLADACSTDASAPAMQLPDSLHQRPERGFLAAAMPLLQQAQSRLRAGVAAIDARHHWNALRDPGLIRLLGEEMVHTALNQLSRTMVLELHVARLEGRLQGDSSEQRFQSFVGRFEQHESRAAFFHEYPVLGRVIARTAHRYVETRVECLERLAADRPLLCEALGGPLASDEIAEMRTIGDPHRGGRGVMFIRFRSGLDLVYKPKPLAVDQHFQALLQWLNDRGWAVPFRCCRLIDRGDYGWMEFVAQEPCRAESEVARFYTRMGGYLALLYVLGATDFHFENLVAAGEQPMLIDLETLFHPLLLGSSPDPGTARVHREIGESVLSVGLLPDRTALGAAGAAVDLSGLGARGDQLSPDAMPCWIGSGTDTMHLSRQRMIMPTGQHAPALNDTTNTVDFSAHVDDILAGFDDMYDLLRAHSAALLADDGPLRAFDDDVTRIVFRPTHSYYVLYREGGHPDLLRDALDRDRHFDRLWAGVPHHPELERLIPYEREDLWWGDIPFFTTRPASRDVWTSRGERIRGYLKESGVELIARRVARLGDADLQRQHWFLRASLATAMPADASGDARTSGPVRRHHLLAPRALAGASRFEVACAIGDRLVDLALTDDSADAIGGCASWLGETAIDHGGAAIRPMGPDLYSGLSGVTLFLASLGTLTGNTRYLSTARQALRSLRVQVASRAGAAGIGGFTGWGSIVYTLSHLAVLFDDDDLARDGETLAASLADSIETDDQLDLLAGAAGFLLALLSLHAVTRSSALIDLARRCGDRLIATSRPAGSGVGWTIVGTGEAPLAGLSHGAAGIALALLKLAEQTGDAAYRKTAIAAMAYERTLFDTEARTWRDLRPDTRSAESCINAWCHGAPGIGLARLAGLSALDDADVRAEIAIAVDTTLREGFEMNDALCHGALGNLELPLSAARVMQRGDWQEAADEATTRILHRLTTRGPVCGSLCGIETSGFMNGLAGIGYALLRLAHPDRVPSVLVMEPPRSCRDRSSSQKRDIAS